MHESDQETPRRVAPHTLHPARVQVSRVWAGTHPPGSVRSRLSQVRLPARHELKGRSDILRSALFFYIKLGARHTLFSQLTKVSNFSTLFRSQKKGLTPTSSVNVSLLDIETLKLNQHRLNATNARRNCLLFLNFKMPLTFWTRKFTGVFDVRTATKFF